MLRKLKNVLKATWLEIKDFVGMLTVLVPFLAIMYGVNWLADRSEAFSLFLVVIFLGLPIWGIVYLIIDFIKRIMYSYHMLEKRDKRGDE